MKNSNRKGKVGEREFAAVLRAAGFDARRGRQYSGSPESPDVASHALAWLHVEVKRTEQLRLREAVRQAGRDCGGKPWLVAHRWNGGRWLAIVDMDFLLQLLRGGVNSSIPAVRKRRDYNVFEKQAKKWQLPVATSDPK
jgi:Holliday junction resolvase